MSYSCSAHRSLVHFRNHLSEFGHRFQGRTRPEEALSVSHETGLRIRAIAIKKGEAIRVFLTNCVCDELRPYEDERLQMEDKTARRGGEGTRNGESS